MRFVQIIFGTIALIVGILIALFAVTAFAGRDRAVAIGVGIVSLPFIGVGLRWLIGRSGARPLVVEAYWCQTVIKLPTKVRTPLGGRVTLITVCVDIHYAIEQDNISIRQVHLSRGGGRIMGSSSAINVAAQRRGEAWYATSICSESVLREVVQHDLAFDNSPLRRIMMDKWREANRAPLLRSLADALNRQASFEEIASLAAASGLGNNIAFTYIKPDGSSSKRKVSVEGVSGSLLQALDHKDGKVKSFRIDRISRARAL